MCDTLDELNEVYRMAYNRAPTGQEIFDYSREVIKKDSDMKCKFLRDVITSLQAENAQLRRNR